MHGMDLSFGFVVPIGSLKHWSFMRGKKRKIEESRKEKEETISWLFNHEKKKKKLIKREQNK